MFAAIFGAMLGVGAFTIVGFVGYYLLLVSCILTESPLHATLLMMTYGAACGVPVLLAPLTAWICGRPYTLRTASSVNEWMQRADHRLAWLRVITLFLVAGSMLAASTRL